MFRTLSILFLLATQAAAQQSEHIMFSDGQYETKVAGTITGQAYFDYTLSGDAGRMLFADLKPTRTDGDGTIYVNILSPGSNGHTLWNGSLNGNQTSLSLPKSGQYTIRVYLMGNDRDAAKTVEYDLRLSLQ